MTRTAASLPFPLPSSLLRGEQENTRVLAQRAARCSGVSRGGVSV
jgi:hypothetical protein